MRAGRALGASAVSIAGTIVLVWACAGSSGALAPVLATAASALPLLWAFRPEATRERLAAKASPQSRAPRRHPGSVDDRQRRAVPASILVRHAAPELIFDLSHRRPPSRTDRAQP